MNDFNENRNWYIRLTARFFNDPEIEYIRSLPETNYGPNYSDFCICLYLEMLCVSIPNNGLLLFGNECLDNDNIAYAVARRYNRETKINLVRYALESLEKAGLIEFGKIPEGEMIFIPAVVNNTGSLKISSEKRQKRRLKAKQNASNKHLEDGQNEKIENEKTVVCGPLSNLYLTEKQLTELQSSFSNSELKKIYYKAAMAKANDLRENKKKKNEIDDYTYVCNSLKDEDINE